MNITFKQYLEQQTKSQSLSEEVIHGGLLKMFNRLQFWFDKGPKDTAERIRQLEKELVYAGGANKFAMVVRRIPSVKNFLLRHKDELEGELSQVVEMI